MGSSNNEALDVLRTSLKIYGLPQDILVINWPSLRLALAGKIRSCCLDKFYNILDPLSMKVGHR
jgi:hypothetical protein